MNINDMEKDPGTKLLNRIGQVDPPPFLFTRIEARISGRTGGAVPRRWVLVTGLSLAVLLAANTLAIQKRIQQVGPDREGVSDLASGMGLRTSNQFYNE